MTRRFGLDTNVLLRVAIDDDPGQREKVKTLLQSLGEDDVLIVSLPVILEVAWVLERLYEYPKEQVLDFLQAILERREVEVPDYQVVGNAIDICRGTTADFSDAIISELNRLSGCATTYTFDIKAARKIPGMELLT
ncbi:PIN domain-containing protein [Agrobacterium larrymoorei]|uniref:Nucleic-acid-binding protein n=1 Tax=Agrobacterium larrymoorei TaxID=160699 RepID=A0AAJ2ESQ8_9HYPH|nr:type II toxin-antitoxin system VapC family toxin [Agrobacterium larrymoorei]MDQ1186886.1 putative nucleic-acid-binding protein [Agrobacterium larrymoorei]MDR6103164.1 putative nucleic-acid-binding protein [Agrobacterium larrymoorei]